MRPQVTIHIEANHGGEMLRSYVAALLEPIVASCDLHLEAVTPRTEPK